VLFLSLACLPWVGFASSFAAIKFFTDKKMLQMCLQKALAI